MALAAQKALLDELMGKNRNACNGENASGPHWSDDDVCKYFLCGFCPHELFVNTKTDLGPCPKTHDDRMKDAYKRSKRCGKMGYEDEFVYYLKHLLEDVDKRIRRGHERLAVNKSVNNPDPVTATEKKEKILALTKRINDLVKQAEELGTEGKVDQAQGVLKLCEQLKFERSQLEGDARPGMAQTKELEVCEICGAFRIKDDAPQRVEEHLSGKMHLGYAKIRDYLRQFSERRPSPPNRSFRREGKITEDRPTRTRDRPISDDRSPRSHSHGHHRSYPHRDDHRLHSKHDSRNDRRHRDRSRSRSHHRSDRYRSDHSSKSSRRNPSPFSAARRPPEGAEDY
ncbi:hypothetical protein EG68_11457 [Paragonimus skrjabini miyazakii]|uniref:Luc7-like protein 3 n=1 Tax=Paragonimus skrjabini miyazakii TaxID=59628 RepID=A0A8S9YJ55_9TREM|nr:hypothetical protein EG68_11457 [Paragonimus skrjabini miyazakii]